MDRVIEMGVCSKSTRKAYWREMQEMITFALDADGPFGFGETEWVAPFRVFLWRWIKRGVPIDPESTDAPKASLQIVIRQVCLALPGLARYHLDAKLWLTQPEARFFKDRRVLASKQMRERPWKPYSEAWIPWNLCLHAPRGTPYAKFNRVGIHGERTRA